ncbi:hypothetical protein FOMPIDRAFT_1023839 [Fomitopsis schrenkii]|uniref:Uncharacterized protein n=1 Tax=Fomitopsis schrenkii TaxID=2126942 RepID=S8E6I0_FOMSC|nr:hypothetical protein FOMPIDRAFT_1023839 [Fomitopsis schrenkii]
MAANSPQYLVRSCGPRNRTAAAGLYTLWHGSCQVCQFLLRPFSSRHGADNLFVTQASHTVISFLQLCYDQLFHAYVFQQLARIVPQPVFSRRFIGANAVEPTSSVDHEAYDLSAFLNLTSASG